MPIEKEPEVRAPFPPQGGPYFKYRVGRKKSESWVTIADDFRIDVWQLIKFNFLTEDPDEVNWYLREYVGCKDTTKDRKNWKFSQRATPGVIYVPNTHHRAETQPCRPANVFQRKAWRQRSNQLRREINRVFKRIRNIKAFAADDGAKHYEDAYTRTGKTLQNLGLLIRPFEQWRARDATDVKVELKAKHWRRAEYEKMLRSDFELVEELLDEWRLLNRKLQPNRCFKVTR